MKKTSGSFKNFWDYNKWKILAGILLLSFLILVITQCSFNSPKTFSILCISSSDNSVGDKLLNNLEENIDFSNTDDGIMNIEYDHIYVPDNKADMANLGTNEQIQTQLISGDCSLLIIDSETLYYYEAKGAFEDLTDIANKYNIPDEDRYLASDGTVCAISVDSNSFLESCDINCEELFVALRFPKDGDTNRYTNADAALEYIINNK